MKFIIVTLALLGAVAADVSHLSNEYLPPHEKAAEESHVSNEYLPPHMAALSHSHSAEYAQQSEEIPKVSSFAAPAPVVEQTQEEPEQQYYTGLVYHEGQESASDNAEASVPAPGSDDFTQQQAAYWTQHSAQQEEAASNTVAEEEAPEPEPAVIPGSDDFTNQQASYASASFGSSASSSSNVDTQYGANGGYIY
ncbi:uncharacterized protein LOC142230001 [Haematobia irritans]|uniref:uncharacterized protein LOC142230001 n=1 Tax=Haematobia irritans TaxID=7368 RepID=UPI003F5082DE